MAYTDGSHASGDTDDSTDDTDGGSGTSDGSGTSGGTGTVNTLWRSIAPKEVEKFAAAPVAFILGAIFDVFIGGVNTIVTRLIAAIQTVLVGESTLSTQGAWGLADLPLFLASEISGAVVAFGTILEGGLSGFFDILSTAVEALGPLAPVGFAVAVGLSVIVGAYVLKVIWTLAVDAINPL